MTTKKISILAGIALVTGTTLWGLVEAVVDVYSVNEHLDTLSGEVLTLREKEEELRKENEYRMSEEYIEKEARDKLQLVQPDETVVVIVEDDKESQETPVQKEETVQQIHVPEQWRLLLTRGLRFSGPEAD